MSDKHEIPAGVTTELGDDTARATIHVDASPQEVFDYVRSPANHAAISGDETVRDSIRGPDLLTTGSSFSAKMRRGPIPYRMRSTVQEFEAGRKIAWAHFSGHRWRWEVEPDGAGTLLAETYDQSTAKFPPILRLLGYPKGHLTNVARSVANVAAHFASR